MQHHAQRVYRCGDVSGKTQLYTTFKGFSHNTFCLEFTIPIGVVVKHARLIVPIYRLQMYFSWENPFVDYCP